MSQVKEVVRWDEMVLGQETDASHVASAQTEFPHSGAKER